MRHVLAAFLVVTLLALPARADMTWLPKWHMTGDEACYDQEGAKKLLEGDAKLGSAAVSILFEESDGLFRLRSGRRPRRAREPAGRVMEETEVE